MYKDKRNFLKTVHKLLKTSNKIVDDKCGDPCIFGKKGKIYVDGAYWYVYTSRSWSLAKEKLGFMKLWQDGDTEGVFRLDRPPSEKEAAKVRNVVGLGKKRELSPEHRAILKNYFYPPALEA